MTCHEARDRLLDAQRDRLTPEARAALQAHLHACAACAHEERAEALLTEALEQRLPPHAAPLALKRRLAAGWPTPAVATPGSRRRWPRYLVPAAAMAALLLVALPLVSRRADERDAGRMVAEAVNDHLRILASQHPLDVESGGIHQVKPWFEGRLDFAPVVSFEGDADFPLKGEEKPLRGVFIRAPRVTEVGEGVEVLAELDGDPVLLRQGRFLVASFHPELTDDTRVHERFLDLVREEAHVGA